MKKLLLLFVLTIVFSMGASAQDKTSDLKKLIELMNSEKMVSEMLNNLTPILKQQANERIQGEDAQKKVDLFVDYMMQELKELSNKLINEDMVRIYSEKFTHEEIKELIKFYESPVGKKIIEKMPEMSTEIMNSMMKQMPEFQEKLKKKTEELK